jgi:acetyl-CoA carboxylase carboxyl transferase subunit alpha
MPLETLDFEEPIATVLRQIEALEAQPSNPERDGALSEQRRRLAEVRTEIYQRLTPWQRVLVARHPARPNTLDYVERLFNDFIEVHGDRRFADDPAIVTGFARYHDQPVLIVGHQKGRDTKQKIQRNFGYARPEGYRKALRAMKCAEKFGRPVVVFVDTPAAYPGVESEERGVAEAIAHNLRELAMLNVPVVVVISGEGGSGGALGIAIGDCILMQEYAVYSVIPPEGCAAILWRDSGRKMEAAAALRITAPDLLEMNIIDDIVPEPVGGAHADLDGAARLLDAVLHRTLTAVRQQPEDVRLERRYGRFRAMGREGFEFIDATPTRTSPGLERTRA